MNVITNWGAFLLTVGLTLVMSPMIVHSLGDAKYGFWSIAVSVTGYYGLFDLGVRAAVGQFVSRYLAKKDFEKLSHSVNTALTGLGLVGIVAVITAVLVAVFFPSFFHASPEERASVAWAAWILGIGVGVKFPAAVFQAIVIANHRFDKVNRVLIARALINAGMVYWVLTHGHGLIGLAITNLISQVFECLVLAVVAIREVPGIKYRIPFISRDSFKEMSGYGILHFIINVSEQIVCLTDTFVVGYALNSVAVTYYSIGANLIPYIESLVGSVAYPLRQIAIGLDVGNQEDSMKTLLLSGTRYLFCFVCFLVVDILLLGHDFLGQWMGQKYLLGTPYASSATILSVLALASLMRYSQSVTRQIMFGQMKIKPLAITFTLEAGLNLVLSLVLVHRIGILGVAVGTLLPSILTNAVIMPVLITRQLGVGLWQYWRTSLVPCLLLSVVVYGIGKVTMPYFSWSGWTGLFINGTLFSTLFLGLAFAFIADKKVRQNVLGRIGFKAA